MSVEGGHGGGYGTPPVMPEMDIQFEGTFGRILGALFLFGLIKHATGNPHYGEPGGHGGGHGGGH